MRKYAAYGLIIESDFELPQVKRSVEKVADVVIKKTVLTNEEVPADEDVYSESDIHFEIPDLFKARITNGNLIEISPLTEDYTTIPAFIMGVCMGAILHQKKEVVLHGSVVTNGTDTILITGESGAGKSTLASIFLRNGWKLLTDDVAVVKDPVGKHLVQPSFPSQKMWEDSPEFESKSGYEKETVFQADGKQKFGISVEDSFEETPHPLTRIVKLSATSQPASLTPMDGFTKVDQLLRNTYRLYMVPREQIEDYFQKCVTMSTFIPMYFANRRIGSPNVEALYNMIIGKSQTSGNSEDNFVINENYKLKRKDNIITADLNGSAVTMNLETGQYYDLGSTGGVIWSMLEAPKTYEELIQEIMADYEIPREECESDIKTFLDKLISDGLVLMVDE